jgi:hypothetical protein
MKRRSERVRLKRLSEMAVGKAAAVGEAAILSVGKAETLETVGKAVAVIPTKTINVPKVEKPTTAKALRIVITVLACGLGAVALAQNGWYSYSRGTTEVDRSIYLALGLFLESLNLSLPSLIPSLWKGKRYGATILCIVFSV